MQELYSQVVAERERMEVRAAQSMHQTWTAGQNSGPDHLGMRLNQEYKLVAVQSLAELEKSSTVAA